MRRSTALEVLFALFLGLVLVGVIYVTLITIYPSPGRTEPGYHDWPITAGTFMVIVATLVMVVALVVPDKMRVIGNGALFGGLFSMVIGIAYTLWSDRAVPRLLILLAALFVTVVIGYVRFTVKASKAEPVEKASSGDLEARVGELERKLKSISDTLR